MLLAGDHGQIHFGNRSVHVGDDAGIGFLFFSIQSEGRDIQAGVGQCIVLVGCNLIRHNQVHGAPCFIAHCLRPAAESGQSILEHGVSHAVIGIVGDGFGPVMGSVSILGVGNAFDAPVVQFGAFFGVEVVEEFEALLDVAVLDSSGRDDGGLVGAGEADHGVVVVIGVGDAVDALKRDETIDAYVIRIAICVVFQGLLDGVFPAAYAVREAEEHADLVAGDLGGPAVVLLADEFFVNQAFFVPLAHGFNIGLEVFAVVVFGPVGDLAGLRIAIHYVDLQGESSSQGVKAGMSGAPPVAAAERDFVVRVAVAVGILLFEGLQDFIGFIHCGRDSQAQTVQPVLADGIAPVSGTGNVGLPVAEGDDGAVILRHSAADFIILFDYLEPVRDLLFVFGNLADRHDDAVFNTGHSAAGILRPVKIQQIRIFAGNQHGVDSRVVVVGRGGSEDGQLDVQAVFEFLEPCRLTVVSGGVTVQFLAEIGDFHGLFRNCERHETREHGECTEE